MHRDGHKRICARIESTNLVGLALVALASFITGCSTPVVKKKTAGQEGVRLRALEKDLKRKQSLIEELRERNLVLERRIQQQASLDLQQQAQAAKVPVPFSPTAGLDHPALAMNPGLPQTQAQHQATAQRLERQAEPETVTGARGVVTGEQRLYSKILETYRSHNLVELQKTLQILLKTYPDSVYADNALYVAGLLSYESKDNARALAYMERVLREYPKGNKAVSALFAKAMILRTTKSKLSEARELLKRVRSMYPGSPEAAQATVEERLLNMMSTGSAPRRES
jgi:TolA-binding protein